ncbi:type VII secretion protein EccE [Nocardia stercoris]|uniref:Type VII secretion protein EccE n=1 Tax=Nocardia stercoris TaxID=2483361 RepID=A0A3M2KVL2_9NOCA|nr:type VII secretion protein EccE [Nocardia stercoris]RMI29509.1 type VII secretion protein EccE [Nocardia stercoris]
MNGVRGVRPGVNGGPLIAFVVVGSMLAAGIWALAAWWIAAGAVGFALLVVSVPLGGVTVAGRLRDAAVFEFGLAARARRRTTAADLRDVEVNAGTCGIRFTDAALVAMIQLAPDLDLPTVIADKTVYTEDTVPIEVLLPLRRQYGIDIEIDIVTTGQRIRSTGGYGLLYDQLIGPQAVVGDRLTWLVVRLDLERNLPALGRRGQVARTGPAALAGAAHRIANRLRESGIAAHVLPASALAEATMVLHAGVDLADLRERRNQLESSVPGRCVTTFRIDWARLGDAGLDDCWSWNRGRTTVVVGLAGSAAGPAGLVRFVGPPATDPLPGYLRRLPGKQSEALLATLPTEVSAHELVGGRVDSDSAATVLSELDIPIGPNGQILGALNGQPRHQLALPLFDPTRYNPRQRTVDVQAALPVAQQIVLRATAVGANVQVHSARPHRWQQLVSAVGDPASLRLAVDAEGTGGDPAPGAGGRPTIEVFDQVPPHASDAPTTVTISDPGAPRRRSADLTIQQVDTATVEVGIPMRTVRVDLIEPRGETRYLESGAEPGGAIARVES